MPGRSNIFQQIPFIRITGLFLIGILLNYYYSFEAKPIAIVLAIFLILLILLWRNSNYTILKIQNFLICISILFLGIFYSISPKRNLPTFSKNEYYLAEVCQKPSEKNNSYQTILKIESQRLSTPEKIVAYFSKTEFDSTITTGDLIVINSKPQLIKNSGNPFEVDYQTMMNRNGIWFSAYLNQGSYLKTGKSLRHPEIWAEYYRDKLIQYLSEAIKDKEARAVVSALTLGYRAEIEPETIDYFASTGAMHVLSVSGLHVALIYFIMGYFLSFLKYGRLGRLIFTFVMIMFLWAYAFITGFTPAVQRATVMFTFVILGNSLRRPVNIYNSLMASAFFLFLLKPEVIFDIGFQLSYLAVFGIVSIQPPLDSLLNTKNKIIKWSWSLFTVSVAAQFITFPLGFYYFNQFPNLFWLSSFIVIPITTIVLWLTILFFLVVPIHGLAMLIGILTEKLTILMLYMLKTLDALPFALIKGIVFTPFQVWLIFGCITAIIIFFSVKNKAWLYTSLILFIFFQISELWEKEKVRNQSLVMIYNTQKQIIHLINGRNNYLISNDINNLSRFEKANIDRVIYHLRLKQPIAVPQDTLRLRTRDINFDNKKIQFLNCLFEMKSKNVEINIYNGPNIVEKKLISFRDNGFEKQKPQETYNVKLNGAFVYHLQQRY